MKAARNFGIVVLIISIAATLYYARQEQKIDSCDSGIVLKVDSIVFVDTITCHDTIYIPKYVPIPQYVFDTVPYYDTVPIDTNKVMIDYYMRRPYNDTVIDDSNLLVIIVDTISRNKIYSRTPFVINNYKQITIDKKETIYLYPKNEYFIGGYLGKSTIGAEFTYKRNKNVFGAGFGTNGLHLKYARKLSKK